MKKQQLQQHEDLLEDASPKLPGPRRMEQSNTDSYSHLFAFVRICSHVFAFVLSNFRGDPALFLGWNGAFLWTTLAASVV